MSTAMEAAIQTVTRLAGNESSDDILMAGYLGKKKSGDKVILVSCWNTRFFVLHRTVLKYYENMASKKVAGSLDLRGVVDVEVPEISAKKKKDVGLLNVVIATRTYELKAQNADEASAWAKALRLALKVPSVTPNGTEAVADT